MITRKILKHEISPSARRSAAYLILFALATLSCLDRINIYIDDVFITLRYVQNILHGAGPVFNPGERLEAISNPVWMWLLSILAETMRLSSPAGILILAKSTAFLLHCLSSFLFFELLYSRSGKQLLSLTFAGIFAAHPFVATFAIVGLENPLLIFLLLAILFLMNKKETMGSRVELWISLLISILILARPEAIMYFPCYLLYLIRDKIVNHRAEVHASVTLQALIPAICMALFAVWRVWYYGSLLPSTVYAKNAPQLSTFAEGAWYVLQFIFLGAGPILLPYFWFRRTVWFGRINYAKMPPLLVFCVCILFIQILFTIYVGGDWMPGFRFLLITFPLLLLLIASDRVFCNLVNSKIVMILVLSFIAGSILARKYQSGFQHQDSALLHGQITLMPQSSIEIAEALGHIASPGQTILIGEAGLVPFLNPQLTFDDVFGLLNQHISRDIGGQHFKRLDPEYFAQRRYDYFVVISIVPAETLLAQEKKQTNFLQIDQVLNHKEFTRTYSPVFMNTGGLIYKHL